MLFPSLASANLPVTVLKFGGSVLRGPDGLERAVREIRDTARAGTRVVAVTSAFAGVTDRLIARARARFGELSDRPLANLLATGESRSAAYLALALDAAGITNELLYPDRIGLRVRGHWLDAEPCDLDVAVVEKAFGAAPVLVVPGFFGRRGNGETAVLGRGGSDLTALFLAERLGAKECRLVKDVDGLFSGNPDGAGGGTPPDRYVSAGWEVLATVGRGLVQTKAIDFARKHRLSFTIAAPLSREGTRIGPGPTERRASTEVCP